MTIAAVLGVLIASPGPPTPVSLEFRISAPSSARVGERVPVTLRLRNPTARPLEAHFLGRDIAFDIVVRDERGAVVWQRLEGRTVPSILQMRMLAPAETMEWRDTWRPESPGTYRLEGILPSAAAQPMRSEPVSVVVR